MKNCFIAQLLLSALILGCHPAKEEMHFIPSHDSLKSFIPRYFSPTDSKEPLRRQEVALGLGSIYNGSTGIEIRLWGDENPSAFDLNERLIRIRFIDSNWSAEEYKIKYILDNAGRVDSIAHQKRQLRFPKSGWQSFIVHLFDLDLLTLPDAHEVFGYAEQIDTDESGYSLEIAEGRECRYISYAFPNKWRQEKFKEAKTLADIVTFIREEFYIK